MNKEARIISHYLSVNPHVMQSKLYAIKSPLIINHNDGNFFICPNHEFLRPDEYLITILEATSKTLYNAILKLVAQVPGNDHGRRFLSLIRQMARNIESGNTKLRTVRDIRPKYRPSEKFEIPEGYTWLSTTNIDFGKLGVGYQALRNELNTRHAPLFIGPRACYPTESFNDAVAMLKSMEIPKTYTTREGAAQLLGCHSISVPAFVKRHKIRTKDGKFTTRTARVNRVYNISDCKIVARLRKQLA